MGGMRVQPQGHPPVDWGVSRTWKAVRLGAGDSAVRAHDAHTLRSSGGPQTAMRGMPAPYSSGLCPSPWRRQGLALLRF